MAKCGWCGATNLQNNKGPGNLEKHSKPNSRITCEGWSTSQFAEKARKK